ncbi:hypothetical protein HNR44_003383 [Geomicrobium halophilum]|uniref:Uncharacterized protein n=1 Tax=Geomicrobium halophilum TaxID=549000 RepID=A0A841PVW2_9BACL|nr:hypothetical protein [Geomicrobium halophilum]
MYAGTNTVIRVNQIIWATSFIPSYVMIHMMKTENLYITEALVQLMSDIILVCLGSIHGDQPLFVVSDGMQSIW